MKERTLKREGKRVNESDEEEEAAAFQFQEIALSLPEARTEDRPNEKDFLPAGTGAIII